VVHEDPAHELRGHAEEMGAVAPLHTALVDEAEVRLADERRRLERVVGCLASHGTRGLLVQLGVYRGHQAFTGGAITVTPVVEQLGDVRW